MNKDTIHWTAKSNEDFQYRVAMDFVVQLEKKMDAEGITQQELARRLGVSVSRVSQVINKPGRLNLKSIVDYARALGLKAAVIAYEDGDQLNILGPVNSEIFIMSWQKLGCPKTAFDIEDFKQTHAENMILRSNIFSAWKMHEPFTLIGVVTGKSVLPGNDWNEASSTQSYIDKP
ncbi:MAG: hypothetical protein A3F68_10275 [Acidobacteria bacterium RIFCSPLOWO2_12_FULL_54_10]|nr:MAG: hypothetical protein A3F68_10275 [Acidobacteria bacterium RIFCSPLOWO2_12_FULL_54_10]